MINSVKSYYSNGKLLLTGEYLVMHGAKALAIPVKYGQSINITEYSGDNKLIWIANEHGNEWFKAVFSSKTLKIEESSDDDIGKRLHKVITEAKLLNPNFIDENSGYLVESDLNFNRNWGLGTSSTLINNIALWANVDPFCLHWNVSNGSGYDIACAGSPSPLIYQLNNHNPVIKYITFNPLYKNNVFFIYLEKKQDSATSIELIDKKLLFYSNEIDIISQLTIKFINATSIFDIIPILHEHETLISSLLNIPLIQDKLFPDFPGIVKSLGAWGGDFVMALSSMDKIAVELYFRNKGFPIVIPFPDMALNSC
jgi:mevalonate kinase